MEIEVGEYVRTDKGIITKAQEHFIDGLLNGKSAFGKAVKHSKNIIDLIEEGDYVNGDKVVDRDNNSILTLTDSGQTCYRSIFESKDIKSVITKEQVKQIEYRIEE